MTSHSKAVSDLEPKAAARWEVEREDQDDGSISWHIFQHRPEYRWILTLNDSEERAGRHAKADAEAIVAAVNTSSLPPASEAPEAVAWAYETPSGVDAIGNWTNWQWRVSKVRPDAAPAGTVRNITPLPRPSPASYSEGVEAAAQCAELLAAIFREDEHRREADACETVAEAIRSLAAKGGK